MTPFTTSFGMEWQIRFYTPSGVAFPSNLLVLCGNHLLSSWKDLTSVLELNLIKPVSWDDCLVVLKSVGLLNVQARWFDKICTWIGNLSRVLVSNELVFKFMGNHAIGDQSDQQPEILAKIPLFPLASLPLWFVMNLPARANFETREVLRFPPGYDQVHNCRERNNGHSNNSSWPQDASRNGGSPHPHNFSLIMAGWRGKGEQKVLWMKWLSEKEGKRNTPLISRSVAVPRIPMELFHVWLHLKPSQVHPDKSPSAEGGMQFITFLKWRQDGSFPGFFNVIAWTD